MDGHTHSWALDPIIDWLLAEARFTRDVDTLLRGLGARLVAAGAPVDRIRLGLRTVHPLVTAISALWRRDAEQEEANHAAHGLETRATYLGSPMQIIADTRAPYRLHIDAGLPPDAHPALLELQRDGITDYFGLPIFFTYGGGALILFGSKHAAGYTDDDIRKFERLTAVLAPVIEAFRLWHLSTAVTDAYLGHRSGQRVMSGEITRGHVEEIDAAIMISDLRGWTTLNTQRPAAEAMALVNQYFDILDAAIRAHDGEILKFMGDGVLAVFPGDDATRVTTQALNAARTAMADAPTLGATFGIALHHGRVQFGNIGAAARLDFTVMGAAVNYAARLEPLTKGAPTPIVLSDTAAQLVDTPTRVFTTTELRGVEGAQKLHVLDG